MEWICNIIVNTLDIVIIYFLYCGLTDTQPKVSIKSVILGILWGLSAGTCAEFLRTDIYTLIVQVSELIILQLLYRRKIYNTVLVSMIIYAGIFTVQIFVLVILFPFSMHKVLEFVVGQILTTGIILFTYRKVALHKILRTTETSVLIRSCVFLFSFIILVSIIYFNLNFEGIKLNMLYFLLISGISVFGFGKTIHEILCYINKLPIILHETKNALAAIYFSLHNTEDIEAVRKDMETYLELLGLDISIDHTDIAKNSGKILSFIEYKKRSYGGMKKVIFETNINYYESYAPVPEAAIKSMLAILLDNAMEASKNGKKIKIDLCISEDSLILSVGNTYSKKENSNITQIFDKGYTSKGEDDKLHGLGLSKLKEITSKYRGEIYAEIEYIKEEKVNYLFIVTVFKMGTFK